MMTQVLDVRFEQDPDGVTVWSETHGGGLFLLTAWLEKRVELHESSARAYRCSLAAAVVLLDDAMNAALAVGSSETEQHLRGARRESRAN